jgi:hypothetical protein
MVDASSTILGDLRELIESAKHLTIVHDSLENSDLNFKTPVFTKLLIMV